MNKYDYKSFYDFLRKTPKNLTSLIMIWGMSLILLYGLYNARYEMHTGWQIFSYIFIGVIIFLGWLRVWQIYQKLKWYGMIKEKENE